MKVFGKRFLFAAIAIVCASVTCIILKYPAEVYKTICLAIVAIFTVGQTVTDYKNGGGKGG